MTSEVLARVLLDTRKLTDGTILEADLCIVGAGAAGITLALQLAGGPLRVCLVESGGLHGSHIAQAQLHGENVGRPYFPLDQIRISGFGGTTAVWAGACRPLDAIDFEARDWVPHSGWPLTRAELDQYYARAQAVCQLGPYTYDVGDWQTDRTRELPLAHESIETHMFQLSPPTRFGRAYRSLLQAKNVLTCTNATVLNMETSDDGRVVTHAALAVGKGKKIKIAARSFVLAAGGIENPRILLLSNGTIAPGLGNQHDLVGRFFMEHLYLDSGEIGLANGTPRPRLYGIHSASHLGQRTKVEGVLAIAASELSRQKLLRCGFLVPPWWRTGSAFYSPGVTSLFYLIRTLRVGHVPYMWPSHVSTVLSNLDAVMSTTRRRVLGGGPRRRMLVRAFAEQSPNPDSRVMLSNRQDLFGRRIVRLDWRLSAADLRSLRQAHTILGRELRRAGVGELNARFDQDDRVWPARLTGAFHHIGTTRMHGDPKNGVVDANCLVHGTTNLFVAGSSVFPTSGYANPTLTIVALAIRLADHLKHRLC